MSMITHRGSIQTTAAALSDIDPLSPSPWDMMLQRRRSSLGLSALLGTGNIGNTNSILTTTEGNGNGGRRHSVFGENMFGAIAELAGIAEGLKAAAAATSTTYTSSPGNLDGGADDAVPDLDMASTSDETEHANLGFANQIRRASVTLNALLSGTSDPMLKPALSMFQSSLASQAASAALDAAATADSTFSNASSTSAHLAAPKLTIEIDPWALESALVVKNRKRSRDAEEKKQPPQQEASYNYGEEDEGTYSSSASEASSSPTPFHLAQPPTKKAKGSSNKAGQKRPRRVMPNSQAVKEAMPKPPPRGLKNPVKQKMYANMEPEAARLEKNRQSAKECRLRKKEYVFNLEKKVAEFENREVARVAELAAVRSELAQLQREYSDMLAKAG